MKQLFSLDLPALRWIWQNVKPRKWSLLGLILLQVVNGVLITERSLVLKDVIDRASEGERESFYQELWFLLLLFLAHLVIASIYKHLNAKHQYGMEMDLKRRLYQTLLTREYASVKAKHTGHWNQRMTSDTSTVASLSVNLVPGFAGLIVRMGGAIIALLYLVPMLVILFIPFGICLLTATMFLKRTTKRMYSEIQDADGNFRVFLQEHLGNLLMIRAFGKEEMSLQEENRVMDEHLHKIMTRNTFMIYVLALGTLAMNGIYLLGVGLGATGILHGTVTYGTFSAILTLIMQARNQVSGMSSYLSNIFHLTASAERLMEAEAYPLDDEIPHSESEIHQYYQNEFQRLEIRDAAFSYTDADENRTTETKVFTHMNLTLRKGEFTALIGESGCGKSTILKVLMCIYPLDAGSRILIGSEENQVIPLDASWRGLFAYVPQGNQLMSGTIRDVIAFGETAEEERLQQAVRIACAEEFISALEEGFDTVLGERGSGLSEGQMQRISIARAIYSQRPILLLDESTSALDQDTEQRLLRNIRQMTDITVVIVTHRPAALEVCDKVISFSADEKNDLSLNED